MHELIRECLDKQDTVTHYNVTGQRDLLETAKRERDRAVERLEDYIGSLYKSVDLEEGNLVQYLGVYVLNWKQEWGPPTVGFAEADSEEW